MEFGNNWYEPQNIGEMVRIKNFTFQLLTCYTPWNARTQTRFGKAWFQMYINLWMNEQVNTCFSIVQCPSAGAERNYCEDHQGAVDTARRYCYAMIVGPFDECHAEVYNPRLPDPCQI